MPDDSGSGLSRRQVLAVSGTGLIAATAVAPARASARAASRGPDDGTPEQIHLTWGDDPARSVVVSWASPGRAVRPRVRIGQRVIPAEERGYTDGLNGQAVWTYHARVHGLRPGATYGYAVTADNDGNAADPFSAMFSTAPEGRAAFRFTSFGDLATPNTDWVLSYGQAAYAVGAVEQFQPLFHLLNGDLCYADLNPAAQPQVWRDFGNNNQASAANRPWMPVPGNHEIEFGNGPQGFSSYLTRYTLPSNGFGAFEGRWYSFRVGSVLFVSLSADDVVYQDAGAFVAGPSALVPVPSSGAPPVPAGTSFYVRGYSGGAQTRWLEATLAAARRDASVDWIVVQLHQCACSSSRSGNGSDLGIRESWLPLFDRYEVDLVLCGHDHDYERSFPVRGFDPSAGTSVDTGAPVDTRRPHPVTTVDSGVFDTSQGSVHLVLGCGGTNANLDLYGAGSGGRLDQAKVFTTPNRPVVSATPGVYTRPGADAVEDATWSARRDTTTGYGIAVFDVNPGTEAGGQTSITVTHYHALGADPVNPSSGEPGAPTGDYTVFESFTLVRPRSDGRRWHAKQSASAISGLTVALAAGGPAALSIAQSTRSIGVDCAIDMPCGGASGPALARFLLLSAERRGGRACFVIGCTYGGYGTRKYTRSWVGAGLLRAWRCASCTVDGMSAVDAVVVGAGVVGLTSAISLAEAGLATRVVAAEPTAVTTSAAAGAVWGPVLCGPADRCRDWSAVGLSVLSKLADEPGAGVRQVSGREVSEEVASPPEWLSLLPDHRLLGDGELPAGFASGWRYTAPVVTMPVYLEYLLARYAAAGGSVEIEHVSSLAAIEAPVVVNCTGVGARKLVPDPSVVPVRGQVVVVRNPGIEEFYIDHALHGYDYVYAFPHGDLVLLGGTAEPDAWDWPPRPEVSARILRDAALVFPQLSGAQVVAERVGLRPYRPTVRLEAESLPGGRVLWHNYGHGGGGVSLSWGCARDLTDAVLMGAA